MGSRKNTAKGADIWAFYEAWLPGDQWYYDDYSYIEMEGEGGGCLLDLEASYDLNDFGDIVYQGTEKLPEEQQRKSFAQEFRRWKRGEGISSFAVTLKADQLEQFEALARAHGWKTTKI